MSTPTPGGQQVGRPLLILLGVVALLAVGYLLITMLGGSDDDVIAGAPSEVASPDVGPGDGVVDPDEPVEAGSEIAAVEPTFEVFDARDPFDQLVVEDANAGDVGTTQPAGDTTTDPTGTTTDPTDPTLDAPAVDDPSVTSSPGQSQTTVGGATIMLEDVYTTGGQEVAVIVVDAEGYEAREGETVAGRVEVLDIAGNCATMRYDDNRFILCEGEQIRK